MLPVLAPWVNWSHPIEGGFAHGSLSISVPPVMLESPVALHGDSMLSRETLANSGSLEMFDGPPGSGDVQEYESTPPT